MKIAWMAVAAVVVLGCGDDDKSGGGATCDQLKSVVSDCYDGFCSASGATTSFCKCWNMGQDISVQTCSCVPKNLDALCTIVDPKSVDTSRYNCSGASDAVSHICN